MKATDGVCGDSRADAVGRVMDPAALMGSSLKLTASEVERTLPQGSIHSWTIWRSKPNVEGCAKAGSLA